MKILILATDYPRPDGYVSQYFIHTRNKEYIRQNIDVSVLSFSAENDYIFEGVNVYSFKTYKKKLIDTNFDILISHAPNIRNHYRFLKKYGSYFGEIVFFFHGHEVLISSKIYPDPYDYVKQKSSVYKFIIEFYDRIKLKMWKKYIKDNIEKLNLVFVSKWMYDMFLEFVDIDENEITGRTHIIYNSIGESFENTSYVKGDDKKYDFITIRNLLDKSKYCVDLVNELAKQHPNYKFCVIGKGKYFEINKKPNNLTYINKHLSHNEVINFLNDSYCALMPTRADAQGVMACEMATFGIPLITSDIAVCKEVFEGFSNVEFINNDGKSTDLKSKYESLKRRDKKNENKKYYNQYTVGKEIALFNEIKSN